MTFLAQAQMPDDHYLIGRVAACAAGHGVRDARIWATQHMWLLSAQPGWAQAYKDATAADAPVEPAAWAPHAGADPEVITDEMIAEGVAAVLESEQPPPTPEPIDTSPAE